MDGNQLAFFGLEPPSPRNKHRFISQPDGKDNLFFAALPDATAAAQAIEIRQLLQTENALSGKFVKLENLHVTLFWLGRYNGIPDGLVEIATQLSQTIRAAPFEATFDKAMSFKNANKPLVLCGSDVAALSALQKQFSAKFEPDFKGGTQKTPHMTLLRANKLIEKRPVEPVRWCVHEFVLIHSLIREGKHEILGRWPLRT